jgi:hypothetical protein
MKPAHLIAITVGGMLSLLVAACTPQPSPEIPPTPSPRPTASGAPTQAVPPPTEPPSPAAPTAALPDVSGWPTGPCEHFLWPLRDGAVWVYRLSGPDQPVELVMESAIDAGGAAISFKGQTSTLSCVDEALCGLPPGLVGHPDLGNQVAGLNPRGDYLPPPAQLLPLGTPVVWDLELDAAGAITLPLSDAPVPIVGGRLVVSNTTGEVEPIGVPAGTFTALPVREVVFFEIRVSLPDGSQQTVYIDATTRRYYAEGVGLVKAVYEGGTISAPGGTWSLEPGPVLELVGFTLP